MQHKEWHNCVPVAEKIELRDRSFFVRWGGGGAGGIKEWGHVKKYGHQRGPFQKYKGKRVVRRNILVKL